ncbi:MAG TPA: YetF domain-containing protein [Rhodanobacteraceae bacterium]|nr:YetF domain-containing protein [Rhodanobacteraceae bacterium]
MHEMLTLSVPWWQLVVRASVVYFVLLILLRLSGKHTMGELSVFDLIVVIVLGSAVRTSLIGDDKSLPGGLIVVIVLLLLDYISTWLSTRSAKVSRVIQGRPVLLARDGVVFEDVLKHCKVPRSNFDSALRKAGCGHVDEVRQAVLEPSGSITIWKRKE